MEYERCSMVLLTLMSLPAEHIVSEKIGKEMGTMASLAFVCPPDA